MNRVTEVREGVFEVSNADPDKAKNRLQIGYGGNGDYYIGTLDSGRVLQTGIQVTGPGGGVTEHRVMLAIAELYAACREAARRGSN